MSRPKGAALGSRWAYVALGLVVIGALAVGSRHDGRSTNAQRIAHLESIIKCPDCADLTIAQSQSAAAKGLRAAVTERVLAGQNDAEIEAYVVKKYTSAEILAPHG
ncbi:MAG TPA: cytochrome c-type biogenesis protein CcmH, partial [Acidimicrobiales bacterium]|nr:cytochrome c-type biogenesis protein CcmH [Acidimicrobiales bacterium]